MKLALRTQLPLLAILAASPLACSTDGPDLPINDLCSQMGLDRYEYLPIEKNSATPDSSPDKSIGSFEPGFSADQGTLIADDDDLTDDYPVFVKATKLYKKEIYPEFKDQIEIFEKIDPVKPPGEYTEAEQAAAEVLKTQVVPRLEEICKNYRSDNLLAGRPVAPTFFKCKDVWSDAGDGVVATYGLKDKPAGSQDAELGACTTVTGKENTQAINAWGPVSTFKTDIGQEVPYDGFTYSGITIPLAVATYKESTDYSEWEGVAMWARLATAEEAIAIDSNAVLAKPLRHQEGDMAQPMDGVGQLGVIIQTIDTAAFSDGVDATAFSADTALCSQLDESGEFLRNDDGTLVIGACFATPADFEAFDAPAIDTNAGPVKYGVLDKYKRAVPVPQPFCIDYSPVDAIVGEEAPFRNQCWDGFRTMKDISQDWKFYFFPFKEMRQAGWGQVAPSFRVDQIRSVNLLTSAFQSVNVIFDEVSYYRRKK